MQRIGDSTTTANGAKEFTQGQPGSGVDATIITVEWLNSIQREFINLVVGGGLVVAPDDDSQVLKAIEALLLAANTWAKLGGKPSTVSGFGITDAYTKSQADTLLEAKAVKATSLAGYGILDAFTKTETGTAIQTAVAALVASSPAALDTLKELAAALGNDPNFATTMSAALGERVRKTELKDAYGIGDSVLVTNLNDAPIGFFYSAPGAANSPDAGIIFGETRGSSGSGTKVQFATTVVAGVMYKRTFSGTWSVWSSLIDSASQLGGLTQAWQDLTASRLPNVTYTNSTGRPIFVTGTLTVPTATNTFFTIDGVNVLPFSKSSAAPIAQSFSVIIKPGSTYKATGVSAVQGWSEMR